MKYFLVFFLVLTVVFLSVPMVYAADEDTAIDKMGDWMATIGKSGLEKDQMLAERKAARTAKRLEQQTKKAAKEAEKSAAETQKKLGLT